MYIRFIPKISRVAVFLHNRLPKVLGFFYVNKNKLYMNLIFNLLDRFSGEINSEKRLQIYDAVYLYEKSGEKMQFEDIVFSSLMDFVYLEIDKIKKEINENKTKINEIQNEKNEIQNEKNEIQNENKTEKKRGCPKGTKKPFLKGNTYAKKRNSNENKTKINEIQNENANIVSSECLSVLQVDNIVLKNENANEIQNEKNEIVECEVEEIENEEENEFYTATLNDNEIEKRKLSFGHKIGKYVDDFGKELCREFYDYWTEKGENDRKMRFEKQKTFEIKKRLARWKLNNEKFNNYGKNKQTNGTNQSSRPKTSTSDENFAKAMQQFLAND